jgi:hypothetical protein
MPKTYALNELSLLLDSDFDANQLVIELVHKKKVIYTVRFTSASRYLVVDRKGTPITDEKMRSEIWQYIDTNLPLSIHTTIEHLAGIGLDLKYAPLFFEADRRVKELTEALLAQFETYPYAHHILFAILTEQAKTLTKKPQL